MGQGDRDRIANRAFVVTGASSGVGRGVALKLAAYGVNAVTVDAVAWAAPRPTKGHAVGWRPRGAMIGDQVWPGLAECLASDVAHRAQVETAPPAPPTTGTLCDPMRSRSAVEGDARARMEREDRQGGMR